MNRGSQQLPDLDYATLYPSARAPVFGAAAIATSHALASQAGMAMLLAGGNAVDAILAAAMALTVVEPTGNGLGSDAFAILWDGSALHGLNASGRAPAAWTPARFAGRAVMPHRGWDSVTVPGAVSGWVALSARFGRLPLEQVAAPAIRFAREGFAVTPITAKLWARAAVSLRQEPGFADCFLPDGRAPRPGELFRSEAQACTLEAIAASKGEVFYRGALARAMAADSARQGGALTEADLDAHRADWVAPLNCAFAGAALHELPPSGQGITALMAARLFEAAGGGAGVDDPQTIHLGIEACKLAMADSAAFVGDLASMAVPPSALLDPAYLAERARLIDPDRAGDPGHGAPGRGGTVCLSAADADGMMISFIQSNYMGFGSGLVVPGTGISLQNRGAGFVLDRGHPNQVGPGKRPFHTIIPGFATAAGGAPLMAFGLMGGFMQAQGHLQMANRILRHGQNPQAAADAPRWRVVEGRTVAVEPTIGAATIEALRARGHHIIIEAPDNFFGFGGAQIVLRHGNHAVAGSDPRKDGQALGW